MPRTKSKTNSKKKMVKQLENRKPKNKTQSGQFFIPTGSTLLNLALSDMHNGGWPCGKIANLIGDSSSGKSFLAMSCFAEINQDAKRFSEYNCVYDDVESANEFDMEKLFGKKTANRIKAPEITGEDGTGSDTIQDFHVNITSTADLEEPFIYILDSTDALTSVEEKKLAAAEVKAAKAKKKLDKGTYGMEKAKKFGQILRQMKSRLANTGSALIMVSQTRADISMSFSTKTRSGGKALKFYSTHEIWTAIAGTIKRKDVPVGVLCRIKVTKNRITGKVREVTIPIYYDYGIDDIESCIDWLVEKEFWKQRKQTILATDLNLEGTKAKLIRLIEEGDMEEELSEIVGECWAEFEESLKVVRKKKYQ